MLRCLDTKLADNTAQFANQTPSAEESAPAASASKGKGPATTDVSSDTQQKQRIEQLEKVRTQLERRSKDRTEELKGKGRLVEEVHDEMVALNLQLNMAEQEKEKLRKENEELTKRWVKKMEEEARKMNERSGWEDQSRRKK